MAWDWKNALSPRKPGRTMEDALTDLQHDVDNVVDIIELAKYPGWIKLVDVLQKAVSGYQSQINELAKNPVKNAGSLQEINALREAVQGFIDVFDTTYNSQADLLKRKQELNDKLEEARLLKAQFEQR
jgi:hypothetical protein